jgi:hypothetical protein
MAIVCPRCGQQNTDDAQFCANRECGEYLIWDGTKVPEPSREAAVRPREPVRSAPPPPTVAGYLNVEPTDLSGRAG